MLPGINIAVYIPNFRVYICVLADFWLNG